MTVKELREKLDEFASWADDVEVLLLDMDDEYSPIEVTLDEHMETGETIVVIGVGRA